MTVCKHSAVWFGGRCVRPGSVLEEMQMNFVQGKEDCWSFVGCVKIYSSCRLR